jgi:hypothetical protein
VRVYLVCATHGEAAVGFMQCWTHYF